MKFSSVKSAFKRLIASPAVKARVITRKRNNRHSSPSNKQFTNWKLVEDNKCIIEIAFAFISLASITVNQSAAAFSKEMFASFNCTLNKFHQELAADQESNTHLPPPSPRMQLVSAALDAATPLATIISDNLINAAVARTAPPAAVIPQQFSNPDGLINAALDTANPPAAIIPDFIDNPTVLIDVAIASTTSPATAISNHLDDPATVVSAALAVAIIPQRLSNPIDLMSAALSNATSSAAITCTSAFKPYTGPVVAIATLLEYGLWPTYSSSILSEFVPIDSHHINPAEGPGSFTTSVRTEKSNNHPHTSVSLIPWLNSDESERALSEWRELRENIRKKNEIRNLYLEYRPSE